VALDDFGTDATSDELKEYLKMPTIATKNLDPLAWWYADKGCFGSYMKLYNLILLSMILQLE